MAWPPIYSVSLTFAECPLQLYLLRMIFCSSAHKKFVSCLMQYSKKYGKWPETYVFIQHSFRTPKFCYFSYVVTISLYNSKILLSLNYFLTLQFQTFTKISHSFFFEIGTNYVSIMVNIISNNTVLQCYLLWIFMSIRKLLQLLVCIGVSTPSHLKNMTPSFAKSPLKSANYQSPLFRSFTSPLCPPKKIFLASYLHICMASYLVSYDNHVKNYRLLLFFRFPRKLNSRLIHSGNENKELFRYC